MCFENINDLEVAIVVTGRCDENKSLHEVSLVDKRGKQ